MNHDHTKYVCPLDADLFAEIRREGVESKKNKLREAVLRSLHSLPPVKSFDEIVAFRTGKPHIFFCGACLEPLGVFRKGPNGEPEMWKVE